MEKIYFILKHLLFFVTGYLIFSIFFIFTDIVFYKIFFGLTKDFWLIYLENFKLLSIVYCVIYILLNLILFLYDKYYIKKLNKTLDIIQGGDNIEN